VKSFCWIRPKAAGLEAVEGAAEVALLDGGAGGDAGPIEFSSVWRAAWASNTQSPITPS